ncbi:MAG: LacI family DNA-binding transcriptional regulator, partial [Chloroflexota bacterium]
MQKNIVTLEQVAKVAGVSMKTVSRVVNKSPQVAQRTRNHVQQVIDELNYQPNRLASSLASGRTDTVGVLVHHSVQQIFAYPFFSELLGGISKGLNENRYDVLLRFMDENMSYTELFEHRRVDGLIVTNAPIDKPDEMRGLLGIPSVFTSRIALDNNRSNMVDSDFYGAMWQTLNHLSDFGHEHIALMTGPEHLAIAHLRRAAYVDWHHERHLPVNDALVQTNPLFADSQMVRDYMETYWLQLSPRPTALIASDDVTAINLLNQLTQMGYTVPQDLSVVGFDNTMLASMANPTLTSPGQQSFQKGYQAALTLLDVIANEPTEPVQIELGM